MSIKRKIFLLLASLFLLCLFISFLIVLIVLRSDNLSEIKKDTEKTTSSTPQTTESTTQSEYDLYPKIESYIDVRLDDVISEFPGGETTHANTTWGEVWVSYEYENDLYIFYADGKATGIIDSVGLSVKKLNKCVRDETVLDVVDVILPYAGIDPSKKGFANNPGIVQGLVSYYEYKEDFVLSVTCNTTLQGESYYQVMFFKNPNAE